MWKEIEGYEGLYEVSDEGEVRVKDRMVVGGRWGKPYLRKGKILNYEKHRDGYFRVSLRKEGKNKNFFVHRLVAINFLENTENYPVVDHIDNNKRNNRKENLRWCTIQENTKWSYEDGLQKPKIGEDHVGSKLTEETVGEIKKLLRSGEMKQSDIARKFEISPSRITEIKKGRTWSHVE